jgi:hypothetical protein
MHTPEKKNYFQHFVEIAERKRYKINKPSYSQRKNNIDLLMEGQTSGNQKIVSLDIKKKSKKDSNNWVYIEYKNSKGGPGWIEGAADFIVFETKSSFILTPRKALKSYLDSTSLVRWDLPFVDKPWLSKYRLYRRKNTLETITQINTEDLKNIKNVIIWEKY